MRISRMPGPGALSLKACSDQFTDSRRGIPIGMDPRVLTNRFSQSFTQADRDWVMGVAQQRTLSR